MKFHKMHGLGNDFVIFDARTQEVNLKKQQIIKICDRNFGVGCDQLIIIRNHSEADVEMQIFNQDGSKASACGNATRCVFQLLGGKNKKIYIFDEIFSAWEGPKKLVSIDMGVPKVKKNEKKFIFGTSMVQSHCDIVLGNHHLVVFDELDSLERSTIGAALQEHEDFPGGINVNFAKVHGRNLIELQTWERGAGFTYACGSGACASAVAANILGYTDEQSVVSMRGGKLDITYDGERVIMAGPASYVFSGELEIERL